MTRFATRRGAPSEALPPGRRGHGGSPRQCILAGADGFVSATRSLPRSRSKPRLAGTDEDVAALERGLPRGYKTRLAGRAPQFALFFFWPSRGILNETRLSMNENLANSRFSAVPGRNTDMVHFDRAAPRRSSSRTGRRIPDSANTGIPACVCGFSACESESMETSGEWPNSHE